MDIKERVVTHYTVHFTDEDVTLVESVLRDVVPCVNKESIFSDRAPGFAKALAMLSAIQESALYNRNLNYRDRDMLQDLANYLCTFEVRFPDDPRFQQVDDLWKSVLSVRENMFDETVYFERL